MNDAFVKHISNYLEGTIQNTINLSGGDISSAYRIETTKCSYFVKCNEAPNALLMFETEAKGLKHIENTNTIRTPKVLEFGNYNSTAYLILEFIGSRSPSHTDFQNFGEKLAQLHSNSSITFGLDNDNFIGKLPQSNKHQFEIALNKGLITITEVPSNSEMNESLATMLKDIKPSLLHGDLWSGNYLISKDGSPFLIDPAIYYGHNEIDIAMSKLFGGFGNAFYEAYFSNFPTDDYTDSRIEIYQLYYILVHLNMFGNSYYGSVKRIIKKFF